MSGSPRLALSRPLRRDEPRSKTEHSRVDRVGILQDLAELFFYELHSTTQTFATCTHIHPYEYTYANPTPMSTSEENVTNSVSSSTETSLTT
jgi:hypothetical protein